jgi:hypothetical protein
VIWGADCAGFCWFLLCSGGGIDEPACRAAGHAPLQPAMEDSLQAHEHRTEGNNIASLLFTVECCECIFFFLVSFARLSRILMRCTPSSPCSLIRWVTSGFALCVLRLGMLRLVFDSQKQDENTSTTVEEEEVVVPPALPATNEGPHIHSFCKTLTASDTSTHGGFSVLRRHADECLPPLVRPSEPLTHVVVGLTLPVVGLMMMMPLTVLFDQDMSQHPPNQELVAKDLHGAEWRFRHIFRGDASLSCLQWIYSRIIVLCSFLFVHLVSLDECMLNA